MKTLIRDLRWVVLSLGILCGLPTAARGEGVSESSLDSTAQVNAGITIADLPPRAAYKHGNKIKSEFDKFEERTITWLNDFWADSDGLMNVSEYELIPRFSYPGTTPPEDLSEVQVEFLLKASVQVGKEGTEGQLDQVYKFKEPARRKLVFLVDGATRIDLGSGEHGAGLSKRNVGSEFFGLDREAREEVVYTVSLSQWLQLCNANALIEGKFGKKQFKIDNPKDFAALKDMTSRLRPE